MYCRYIFTDHITEINSDKDDSSLTKDKFLVICQSLAVKMLSNANLFLVSVDLPVASNLDDASGLRLRFSCEILSNSIPCLITIMIEGNCSDPLNITVKVNCEETVFGLNLLNRIVNFLVEPPISQLWLSREVKTVVLPLYLWRKRWEHDWCQCAKWVILVFTLFNLLEYARCTFMVVIPKAKILL